jgi:hypothetical protein
MSWKRTKEIPPGSGNYYAYKGWIDDNGNEQQEYLGPASSVEGVEDPASSEENIVSDGSEELSDEERKEIVKELTKEGAIVGKDASEIITREDVDIIKSLDTAPMYVSEEMLYRLRGRHSPESVENYRTVQAETTIPSFTGVDGESYPPSEPGDKLELPEDNAEILVNRGTAKYIGQEQTRETKDTQPKSSENPENKKTITLQSTRKISSRISLEMKASIATSSRNNMERVTSMQL